MIVEMNDGGIFRLRNPGDSSRRWESMNGNLRTLEMYSIGYDPVNDAIFAGTQDNGTVEQNDQIDDDGDGEIGGVAGAFGRPKRDGKDNDNDGFVDEGIDEPDEKLFWGRFLPGDGGIQNVAVMDGPTPGSKRVLRYSMPNTFSFFLRREFDENGFLTKDAEFVKLNRKSDDTGEGTGLNGRDGLARPNFWPHVSNAIDPTRLLIGNEGLYEGIDAAGKGTFGDVIQELFDLPFNRLGAGPPDDSALDADIDALYSRFEEELYSDHVTVEVVAPLYDFSLTAETVQLDHELSIVPFRQIELAHVPVSFPGERWRGPAAAIRVQYQTPKRIGERTAADITSARGRHEQAIKKIERALCALAVFRSGALKPYGAIIHSPNVLGTASLYGGVFSSAFALPSSTYTLSIQDVPQFAELWQKLMSPEVRRFSNLDVALRRFADAAGRWDLDDRLVDLHSSSEDRKCLTRPCA